MIRRDFLKRILMGILLLITGVRDLAASKPHDKNQGKDTVCTIYRTVNGSPDENIKKVVEMMGGIEKLIEPDAVVLIKPNVQWWNQGAPNLAILKALVDLIINRLGRFTGEIVVVENCHRGAMPWKSLHSGWAPSFERNSDVPDVRNMNELCARLKGKYGSRFSAVHLVDLASGAKRVFSPKDGEGYAYCDGTGGVPLIKCDNGATGGNLRSTIMTYPIFRTERGTNVDFKNGVWEKGAYTGQPLRLINLAALNHHSAFCGMTIATKNYMGITDLSGGSDPAAAGRLTGPYCNFHSFAFDGSAAGPVSGILGKAIGTYMKSIRIADLNITTAEWIGLTSRTNPPVARTRTILASTDPVALDYHAAKYLLYPNSKVPIHDPDNKKSPLRQYLVKCAEESGGVQDETRV
ncbi:MAG: DUF362 domain-containing protein, partial [Proteobacteria bacterium]|nr:DUF362 domain-containing protein [Pseudomonadota bacterium]